MLSSCCLNTQPGICIPSIFSYEQSGIRSQPTDIIKADIIGKLKSEKERQLYNHKWEELEVSLTRNGFNDLFNYIRMVYAKTKPKRSLLEEFRADVLPKNPDPSKFIDDVLAPFAAALEDIRTASFASTAHSETINQYITWLLRIDNSDWIPPAMLFLKEQRNKPNLLVVFFGKLERLAAYMHICQYNVNDRIEAYANLITDIQRGLPPDKMVALDLDEEEQDSFREALDGDIYELTPRRRNYLMLRLDSFISDGAAVYDPKILTIEHVLPQTVPADSEWENWWPDETERKAWVHRIANLVPLNKKKNSAAQNFSFERKCGIYFSGAKNISSYALTSQVISKKEWTFAIVGKRQTDLLAVLYENWSIQPS